jgi:hypothetical protein
MDRGQFRDKFMIVVKTIICFLFFLTSWFFRGAKKGYPLQVKVEETSCNVFKGYPIHLPATAPEVCNTRWHIIEGIYSTTL